MAELIPLALVGLLCGYWWHQGKKLHRQRQQQEDAARAQEKTGSAGDPP